MQRAKQDAAAIAALAFALALAASPIASAQEESAEPAPPSEPPALTEEEIRAALRDTPHPVRLAAPDSIPVERSPGDRIGAVGAVLGEEIRIDLTRPLALPPETLLHLGDDRAWVIRTEGRVAWARLDLNAQIEEGAEVVDSGRVGRYSLIPPLPLRALDLGARVRVGFPYDRMGFVAVYDLRASYLFELGVRVGAEVTPLVFGVTDRNEPSAMGAHAFATYASRWIEVGLGLGFATRLPPGRARWDPTISRSPYDYGRLSLQQRLRLGSQDGLSFEVRVTEIFDGERWDIGDIYGDVRIPIARGVWLYGDGGGGNTGTAYGQGGVRLLVEKDGAMGRLFLILTGGIAVLQTLEDDLLGPLVGVGVDWRIR